MAETKSFEEKLSRLEQIVRELEKGEASLNDSITLYTEGARLIGECNVELEKAEQTVVRVQKGADGEPVEFPFDAEAEA